MQKRQLESRDPCCRCFCQWRSMRRWTLPPSRLFVAFLRGFEPTRFESCIGLESAFVQVRVFADWNGLRTFLHHLRLRRGSRSRSRFRHDSRRRRLGYGLRYWRRIGIDDWTSVKPVICGLPVSPGLASFCVGRIIRADSLSGRNLRCTCDRRNGFVLMLLIPHSGGDDCECGD